MSCLQFVGPLYTFVGLKRFSTSIGSLLHISKFRRMFKMGKFFKSSDILNHFLLYLENIFGRLRAGVEII